MDALRLLTFKGGDISPTKAEAVRLLVQAVEVLMGSGARCRATSRRSISCAEELSKHVALPRGCRIDLEELLRVHGVALDVVDERVAGVPLDLRFQGKLTAVQESAARALLAHDTGILVAPPDIGKTVIGTYLVAARACSTLILVHRRPLLDQWIAQLTLFLGVERKEVGQIAGARRTPTGRLDDLPGRTMS